MDLAITIIALLLIGVFIYIYRKSLFTDKDNIKILVAIFVFLPLVVLTIIGAALFN